MTLDELVKLLTDIRIDHPGSGDCEVFDSNGYPVIGVSLDCAHKIYIEAEF